MEVSAQKEESAKAEEEKEKEEKAKAEEEKKPEPTFEIIQNPARVTIRQSGQYAVVDRGGGVGVVPLVGCNCVYVC